jgi:hypothetical protein
MQGDGSGDANMTKASCGTEEVETISERAGNWNPEYPMTVRDEDVR